MDAVSDRHIDAGTGTPEASWRAWIDACRLPCVRPADLVRAGQRAVIVAPHPDDEVLMAGGLLAELAATAGPGGTAGPGASIASSATTATTAFAASTASTEPVAPAAPVALAGSATVAGPAAQGRAMAIIAVTDGEASHPGSILRPRDRLARQRADETALALARLGCTASVSRLALPDGHVAEHLPTLTASLARLLQPSDVVFTTWALDGHPDHEATARATREAAAAVGARVYEVPVWGWHWAQPGEPRMRWHAAVLVPLSPQAVQRKRDAVLAFASQWERDDACADTPILRPSTLQRAERPYEVVFG
jgi:LmbE family N-acetylglucosaminyl deacetylase